MKHKCRARGCARKGVWLARDGRGAYCPWHRDLAGPRPHRDSTSGQRGDPGVGAVHEGRKVGRPRAWREARHGA